MSYHYYDNARDLLREVGRHALYRTERQIPTTFEVAEFWAGHRAMTLAPYRPGHTHVVDDRAARIDETLRAQSWLRAEERAAREAELKADRLKRQAARDAAARARAERHERAVRRNYLRNELYRLVYESDPARPIHFRLWTNRFYQSLHWRVYQ